MSREKYHITISDNETGRVVHDLDTGCLIGAFAQNLDELDFSSVAFVSGLDTMEYCACLLALETTMKNIYRANPELLMGVSFLKEHGEAKVVDMSKLQEMVKNTGDLSAED